MQNKPTAVELTDVTRFLTVVFEHAVESSPEMEETLTIAETTGAMDDLEEAGQKFFNESLDVEADTQEAADEITAAGAIVLQDKIYAFYSSLFGEDTIKDLILEKHKTQANSDGFTARKVPTLARLYAPK